MFKSAHISKDCLYRYGLSRIWDANLPSIGFVMLNPSVANAEIDDPTIRRCIGFAKRENYGELHVANLFGYRATQPSKLLRAADPFGPENDASIEELGRVAHLIVCAWGAHTLSSYRDANKRALEILRASNATLFCLGYTANHQPRHPLYVKGDQPFEPFDVR